MTLPDFEALAGRQTVSEFVAEYGLAERDIRAGFALVKRGLEALGEGTSLYVNHYVDFEDVDEVATMLRRKAWSNIVDRLQMRRAMNSKSACGPATWRPRKAGLLGCRSAERGLTSIANE